MAREQAIVALKGQLDRVSRLERRVSDEDRRLGVANLISTRYRTQFNETLCLLADAGEDTSGLYLPPGRPAAEHNAAPRSPDAINATIVRRHIERALERFDSDFPAAPSR